LEPTPGTIERGLFDGIPGCGHHRVSLAHRPLAPRASKHCAAFTRRRHSPRVPSCARRSSTFHRDLMYALPQPTHEEALEIPNRVSLEPRTFSSYQLTLEPGTRVSGSPPHWRRGCCLADSRPRAQTCGRCGYVLESLAYARERALPHNPQFHCCSAITSAARRRARPSSASTFRNASAQPSTQQPREIAGSRFRRRLGSRAGLRGQRSIGERALILPETCRSMSC